MRMLWPCVMLVAGCEAAAAPKPDLAEQVRAARDRMHQRFEASKRMQLAISMGQLERAQVEARTIDALDEPDALPEWRTYVDNIRAVARDVAGAKDTVAAARSAARLARECAKCHEAIGAKVVYPKEPQPRSDVRLSTQMFSHQWAAARMWEGLVAPNDERWQTGAKTLAKAPLNVAAEGGTLGIADDIGRIRLLARRALTPQSQTERMELYGELLGTCAHCHRVIRD